MKSREHPSLATSVEAARAEDEQARRELHERVNPRFERFADNFLWRKGCRPAAEHGPEVVNDAWVVIFDKLDTLKSADSFLPWGFEIIRSKGTDHLRQCIKQQRHEVSINSLNRKSSDESGERDIPFDPPSVVDLEGMSAGAEFVDEVWRMAERISPKFYEILKLRVVEGMNMHEIADRIGESHQNTRNIYNRKMKVLQKRLARKMGRTGEKADPMKGEKNDTG